MDHSLSARLSAAIAFVDERPWLSRLLFCLLFAASVAVRFFLSDYPRVYNFYQDELIYGSYANTLLHDGKLLLYGLPIGFFRPIYSLLIMPASLCDDPFARQTAVALINAIVITSGAFPVWLLAKRLLKRRVFCLLGVLYYLVTSDLVYSQTFMTEVAFAPLSLWLVLVFWELENLPRNARPARRVWLSLVFGVCMALCFLCKGGAALVFPASYGIYLVVRAHRSGALRRKVVGMGEFVARHHKRFASLAAVVIGFAVVFVLFHLLIPSTSGDVTDMGNKLAPAESLDEWLYFLYAAAFYLVAAVVACAYFPLVVPFQNKHLMDKGERHLFDFLLISLVVMAVTVSLTISLKEDLFEPMPRTHLRYVMYLTAPLMLIFIREMQRKRKFSLKKNLAVVGVLVGILVAYLVAHTLNGDITLGGDLYDETTLKLLTDFGDWHMVSLSAICVLLVCGAVLLVKKRTVFAVVMVAVMFGVQIANGVFTSLHMRDATEQSEMQQQQIRELLSIDEGGTGTFLLIESEGDKVIRANAVDTFMDYRKMYTISYSSFADVASQAELPSWSAASADLHPVRKATVSYPGLNSVDYLIVPNSANIEVDWGSFTRRYTYPAIHVTVYVLSDQSRVPSITTW